MQPGLLLIVAISLSAIMALAWALERKSGKSGWIDAIWSFSVGLGSVIAVMLADATWQRRSAILILILAWSLRLGLHIAQRSMGHGEDPRYAKLIKEWGEKASSRLFWFLQIQALAAFMLVLAVYLAAVSRPAAWPLMAITASPWSWLSLLAPIQMYWLLVHVSGIPPLEEHMLKSRGDKFRALQSRVNAFFPGPRKSPARSGAST